MLLVRHLSFQSCFYQHTSEFHSANFNRISIYIFLCFVKEPMFLISVRYGFHLTLSFFKNLLLYIGIALGRSIHFKLYFIGLSSKLRLILINLVILECQTRKYILYLIVNMELSCRQGYHWKYNMLHNIFTVIG